MSHQDPQELLQQKHEQDEHKKQFTQFSRNVSGHGEVEAGQEFSNDRLDDDQNRMKTVENKRARS
ncbi:hypothetical protein [Paenibacillus amylolyticus]|uniref:hypothetical protein n=1 Tax=Paenibacillus amylolyticus TaxID=1451 RepID=UPI003D989DE6